MLSFKSFSKSQKISGIRHNWHFSSFSNVLQKQYFSPLNLICNKVFIRKKRQFVSIFEMINFLMKFLLGHFFMFTLHFFFIFLTILFSTDERNLQLNIFLSSLKVKNHKSHKKSIHQIIGYT